MSRVTFHVGMPKTGTTTLQHAFAGQHGESELFVGPHSPEFPTARHFCVLATRREGWPHTLPVAPEMRLLLQAHRDHTLELCGGRGDTSPDAERLLEGLLRAWPGRIVFSDETMTQWGAVSPVCAVLAARRRPFDAIGYIRGLASSTPALMQELVRSSPQVVVLMIRFFPEPELLQQFSPSYRGLFAPWVEQPGVEDVVIRPYPELVPGGGQDLIRDFSEQIGMQPLRPGPALNAQESVEATAISYALLHEMAQSGFDQALFDVARSLSAGLGSTRLVLGADALEEILRRRAADLEWARSLTGLDMSQADGRSGLEVSSVKGLRDLAEGLRAHLATHIEERWGAVSGSPGLAHWFAELRGQIVDDHGVLFRLPHDFDGVAYLAANPDVALAGADPGDHYRRHGFREGRHRAVAGAA